MTMALTNKTIFIDLIREIKDNIREMDAAPQHLPAIVQKAGKPSATNVMTPQAITNAYIVIATLYGEARDEGEAGMHAVMNVIMNRSGGDSNKAKNVVLARKQFSCWNGIGNPAANAIELADSLRNDKSSSDGKMYMEAVRLYTRARKNELDDITGGATHYFNPAKANPEWKKDMKKTTTIGHHTFYKSKKK